MKSAELKSAEVSDIRELTQDELTSVTGGFILVHIARTAATLVALGVTLIRESGYQGTAGNSRPDETTGCTGRMC
jgi:hypothetical protein